MIIFINKEKSTYFYLNPKTQSLGSMDNDYAVISRYSDIPIHLIHVENYKAIQKFQRILKSQEFKAIPSEHLKQAIMDTYPEMFL